MRDETDITVLSHASRGSDAHARTGTATIIPFPGRGTPSRHRVVEGRSHGAISEAAVDALLVQIPRHLDPRCVAHAPTLLSALGALAGFAAQQQLLHEGAAAWTQPKRAEHLDRLLMSPTPRDDSLWHQLHTVAHAVGAQHLPDPSKLLQSTLRCVGTTQFGLITLPLEYKLLQQPQSALLQLWAPLCRDLASVSPSNQNLHRLFAAASARSVCLEHRSVPPHVALRIVMQAALAMALVEPRVIAGAAVKPHVN